jgi:hypothetical protein
LIGASRVLWWISGHAETGPTGGAKVLGRQRFEVEAYRCAECGHLELFVK